MQNIVLDITKKKIFNRFKNSIINLWFDNFSFNQKILNNKKLIKKYLETISERRNFLILGLFNKNALVGFIIFGDESKVLFRLVIDNFFHFFFLIIRALLVLDIKSISVFLNFFLFYIQSFFVYEKSNKSITLIAICIKKKFRGNNLGSLLIKKSLILKKKYFHNFDYILVKTLKRIPLNIKFYKNNNFNIYDDIFGRVYLRLKIKRY